MRHVLLMKKRPSFCVILNSIVEQLLSLSPETRSLDAGGIEVIANLLSSVHSLRDLCKESLLNMAKHCGCKFFLPGQKIIKQGGDDHNM
jgi:hypothetical protein